MTLHEFGHWMDSLLGGGAYASNAEQPTAAWAASAGLPDEEREIWRRPQEVFARVYSQYVASRSGSIRLRRQMDRALHSPVLRRRLLQWANGPNDDWWTIAMAMDKLLAGAQWLARR